VKKCWGFQQLVKWQGKGAGIAFAVGERIPPTIFTAVGKA
jgi:hypothetical protein